MPQHVLKFWYFSTDFLQCSIQQIVKKNYDMDMNHHHTIIVIRLCYVAIAYITDNVIVKMTLENFNTF